MSTDIEFQGSFGSVGSLQMMNHPRAGQLAVMGDCHNSERHGSQHAAINALTFQPLRSNRTSKKEQVSPAGQEL